MARLGERLKRSASETNLTASSEADDDAAACLAGHLLDATL
jgi:hypothetical protein